MNLFFHLINVHLILLSRKMIKRVSLLEAFSFLVVQNTKGFQTSVTNFAVSSVLISAK